MKNISFYLTAGQLATIKATPYQFATMSDAPALARVPRGFTVYKPAGTAYTVGTDARLEVKDDVGNLLFSVRAEGLLDSAAVQKRYVEPVGRAFYANSTAFKVSFVGSVSAISGAGPDVHFGFYFDEVPMKEVQ